MVKIIDIATRKEIVELPITQEMGEQLIMDLFEIELKRASDPFGSVSEVLSAAIRVIENSSGASRYDVMDRFYQERQNENLG